MITDIIPGSEQEEALLKTLRDECGFDLELVEHQSNIQAHRQ